MSKRNALWLGVALAAAAFAALSTVALRADGETPEPEEYTWVFGGRHAWLGVSIADVNAEKARELKLAGEYGALVTEVEEGSPAAKAGLKKDDVITEFDGEHVRSAAHLVRLVGEVPAGRAVEMKVSRGGASQKLTATLEARPRRHFSWSGTPEAPEPPEPPEPPEVFAMPEIAPTPGFSFSLSRGPRLGIHCDEVSGQLAEYFGVKGEKGVLVREVIEGTPAEKAGLKAGDIILRVADESVEECGDIGRALRRQKDDATVPVTVLRNRSEQSVQVKLEKPAERGPRRSARTLHWDGDLGDAIERKIRRAVESAEVQEALQRAQAEVQVRQRDVQRAVRDAQQKLQEEMRQLERSLRQRQHRIQRRSVERITSERQAL